MIPVRYGKSVLPYNAGKIAVAHLISTSQMSRPGSKSKADDANAGACEFEFEVGADVEVLWQEEGEYFLAKVRDRATVFFVCLVTNVAAGVGAAAAAAVSDAHAHAHALAQPEPEQAQAHAHALVSHEPVQPAPVPEAHVALAHAPAVHAPTQPATAPAVLPKADEYRGCCRRAFAATATVVGKCEHIRSDYRRCGCGYDCGGGCNGSGFSRCGELERD